MNDTVIGVGPARLRAAETLGLRDGVTWLATGEAASAAQAMLRLRSWPGQVLAVVAADDVPAGLGAWARACAGKARYVLLFGPHAPRLAQALLRAGVTVVRCADVADAVQAAGRLAQPGDAVALTPLGAADGVEDLIRFRACAAHWVVGTRGDAWVAA